MFPGAMDPVRDLLAELDDLRERVLELADDARRATVAGDLPDPAVTDRLLSIANDLTAVELALLRAPVGP